MAYIRNYYRKSRKGFSKGQFCLESDIQPFDFYVRSVDYSDSLEILKQGNRVALVGGGITIDNEQLESREYGTEFVLSSVPERILTSDWNCNYKINSEPVGSLNWGGGIFSSFKQTIKNKKYTWCHQYIEIKFDENKISPLLALCILMKRVCYQNSND